MTVVQFPAARRLHGPTWHPDELQCLVGHLATPAGEVRPGQWEVGETECGDPQFYYLGLPPEPDCLLCVSRVGGLYVLEDAVGRLLAEERQLPRLIERAHKLLWGRRRSQTARLFVGLCAARLAMEEKLAVFIGETEELLLRIGPQLAALA